MEEKSLYRYLPLVVFSASVPVAAEWLLRLYNSYSAASVANLYLWLVGVTYMVPTLIAIWAAVRQMGAHYSVRGTILVLGAFEILLSWPIFNLMIVTQIVPFLATKVLAGIAYWILGFQLFKGTKSMWMFLIPFLSAGCQVITIGFFDFFFRLYQVSLLSFAVDGGTESLYFIYHFVSAGVFYLILVLFLRTLAGTVDFYRLDLRQPLSDRQLMLMFYVLRIAIWALVIGMAMFLNRRSPVGMDPYAEKIVLAFSMLVLSGCLWIQRKMLLEWAFQRKHAFKIYLLLLFPILDIILFPFLHFSNKRQSVPESATAVMAVQALPRREYYGFALAGLQVLLLVADAGYHQINSWFLFAIYLIISLIPVFCYIYFSNSFLLMAAINLLLFYFRENLLTDDDLSLLICNPFWLVFQVVLWYGFGGLLHLNSFTLDTTTGVPSEIILQEDTPLDQI